MLNLIGGMDSPTAGRRAGFRNRTQGTSPYPRHGERPYKTVIIVTHNAPIAEMTQTVLHMRDGKIDKMEFHEHPKDVEEIIW